jgi:hypothetical protein
MFIRSAVRRRRGGVLPTWQFVRMGFVGIHRGWRRMVVAAVIVGILIEGS